MAKMIAVEHGFYKGRYIRKGETFEFPDKERPRGWMVKATDANVSAIEESMSAKKAKTPTSLSELAKINDRKNGSSKSLV